MFQEVLRDVVERTEGSLAALVMGFDGIAVDSYARADADAPVEVETVGMELSVILKEIRKASGLLDVGDAREVSIRSERLTTVVRLLNEEYFVAVALGPEGNHGKARWLLRLGAEKLTADLGG